MAVHGRVIFQYTNYGSNEPFYLEGGKKMEYAIFPMKTISISQRFHEKHKAWDLNGEDTGIDYWYAPCRIKVLAMFGLKETGFYNTVLFGSCDEQGNQASVMCEDGIARVLTFGCTHMNDLNKFGLSVGKIYESGERCYCEGNTGLGSTGNHVHMDVAVGWHYKREKVDGQWLLPNLTNIANVFYRLKDWNVERNLNGYTFTEVDSREIKEEKPQEVLNGVYGIDVSAHDQDLINYDRAKEKVKFAIARCGYGADKDGQHDSYWQHNLDECKRYNIPMGAYIYSYAESVQEAINEAKHIIRLADEAGGPSQFPYGLWFDIEDKLQLNLNKKTNTEMCLSFLELVRTAGYKAGIYTYKVFAKNYFDVNQLIEKDAYLWIASYGVNDGFYRDDDIGFNYHIRQYTSTNSDKEWSTRKSLDQNVCWFDFLNTPNPEPPVQPEDPTEPNEPQEPETPQETPETSEDEEFKSVGKQLIELIMSLVRYVLKKLFGKGKEG